jgi:mRNA-degrading endonuclease RelE of RelBE toxin-antitoxin system
LAIKNNNEKTLQPGGFAGLNCVSEKRNLMYQVNFSNQSMAELNKLSVAEQMTLVDALSSVTPERLATDRSSIGSISREGKIFHRLRVGELRVYFAVSNNILRCDYILHKHTYADFAFRMKLRLSEEQQVEQEQSFWEYLDKLPTDTSPTPTLAPTSADTPAPSDAAAKEPPSPPASAA